MLDVNPPHPGCQCHQNLSVESQPKPSFATVFRLVGWSKIYRTIGWVTLSWMKNTFLPIRKTYSEHLGWKAPETTTPHLIQNPSKSDPSSWFKDYINYISSATHSNPGNPPATSISISSLHLDPTPLTPAVMKLLHRSPQSVGAWLITITWLVVSTHLKNISQNGFIFPN